jgi:hypothetical protein
LGQFFGNDGCFLVLFFDRNDKESMKDEGNGATWLSLLVQQQQGLGIDEILSIFTHSLTHFVWFVE